MMTSVLQYLSGLVIATIMGAGLMSGLLFAFSNFVMRALSQMPAAAGMEAMQRVNVEIVNPVFLVVFLGTTLLSALVVAVALLSRGQPGMVWLLAGGLCFLVGTFGITMAFSVPLNNALATAQLSSAGEHWPEYVQRWQAWNHGRTLFSLAATGLLAVGLFQLSNCRN